jgi:hypothetical protein
MTMNFSFSSTTDPALLIKEESVYPMTISQNVRVVSPRNEERLAPLAGNKRPRQDDSIPERGRRKIARSSLILTQRSNTMKAL